MIKGSSGEQPVLVRYLFAAVMVAAAFGLRMLLEPVTGTGAPFVLFFGAVAITSVLVGHWPAIGATLLSIPLAAHIFVVSAGHSPSRAAFQSALFAVDCLIVVYLSFLLTRARRAAESTGERLRLANQAAAIASWDLDVATGRLRWSPDTCVFQPRPEGPPASLALLLSLLHPDDRDAFQRAYRRSLDPTGDGAMRSEVRVILPDGDARWLSWQGRTHHEERGDGRAPVRQVGTAIDVTERRQREDDLRALTVEVSRSEARRRDLIELAPDAFLLADLDGRFTDVNQAACRMLGYQREELVGKTILDIIPAEDAPRLAAVRAALLVPGQVNTGEWTQKRKDGTFIPVEVSSNILPDGRWQAFVRDISQRKRIADERQVFVSLLENSSDFIGIADPSGKPIYLNPAGRRMVGLAPDFPVETVQIADCYPPELRSFVSDVILRSMRERGRWSGETYFRHWQTEEAIPVSDEHFVIRDPSGQRVIGMGTVTRDISETRRTAREREELLAHLRESEERFRLTIDEAPIGMALVTVDGRFARVNGALCEIVGYTAEELERLRFQDITHPQDLDSDLALQDRLARGELPRFQLEKRYIRKDGRTVTVMLNVSILRGHDGAPLYYIAQTEDITERKRAESALRFSEARFSGIISIAADAIISTDEDQRILLFNDGAARIFGYSRAEAVGAPLEVLIPGGLRAEEDRLATMMGRRKNGEAFPAEAATSRLHVDGHTILTVALRDITERKRVEKDQRFLAEAGALLASSLDYEQTLTTLGTLVVRDFADWCIVDTLEDGDRPLRLTAVSADPRQAALAAQLERIPLDRRRPHLTLTALETKRSFLIERMTPDQLQTFAQSAEHLRLLRAVDPRSVIASPLLIRGELLGGLILISSTPSRVYGPADLRLAEALAERAALAIENGRLYRKATHATQLRDEVLGVVAHDLRNPLAVILMQAEALQRKGPEPERRNSKPRERILRAADRMNRLIRDLLDVTLIDAGQLGVERARLSARQLLADTAEEQRPLASSASLKLGLDLASDLPDVWADQHRLRQVLENLVGNAIKFTPAGGRVTVGAAAKEREVLFWVADTGCGISPDDLPHVFDRFWQARKSARKGAGLGLPITRGIVEAHGGRIWLESTPGRGTIFFFTIPEAQAAEPARSGATSAPVG